MKRYLLFSAFFIFLLTGCTNSLVHTWNIDKFETVRENGENSTYNNIGTITLNKNKTGNNNLSIKEVDYIDKAGFKWEEKNGYIILKGVDNQASSRLFKAWIVTTHKSKKQVWKSTNGKNDIQILELSRN